MNKFISARASHLLCTRPVPRWEGSGNEYSRAGMYYVMQGYAMIIYVVPAPLFVKGAWILRDVTYGMR